MKNLEPIIIDNERVDFIALVRFIKFFLKSYFKICLFFIFIFLTYFFIKTPNYMASVSFYTNYEQSNSSNIMSFLPGNLGLKPESDLRFSVQDYLKSEKFLNEIVLSEYSVDGELITLKDLWGKSYNSYWSINPISQVKKINNNLMFSPDISDDQKKISYASEILKGSIKFSQDNKSSLVRLSVIVKGKPDLAQQIIQASFDSILEYSKKIVNSKGSEKRRFIESRLQEIKKDLNKYESDLVYFLETNKNIKSPMLQLQKSRIEKNINLYNQLELSLSDQLEIAKIDEKDSTSTIFILDNPTLSSKKVGVTFVNGTLIVLFGCFIFFYGSLFILNKDKLIA